MNLRKPWKRDRPMGARATTLAMGLKPESKLCYLTMDRPSLSSPHSACSHLYILRHLQPLLPSCHVHANTHGHILACPYTHSQVHANMPHMYADTDIYKYICPCAHTCKYIQYACRHVCICTDTHTFEHKQSQNTCNADACNRGICVHTHTQTHENT